MYVAFYCLQIGKYNRFSNPTKMFSVPTEIRSMSGLRLSDTHTSLLCISAKLPLGKIAAKPLSLF